MRACALRCTTVHLVVQSGEFVTRMSPSTRGPGAATSSSRSFSALSTCKIAHVGAHSVRSFGEFVIKAIVYHRYGPPDLLALEEVDKPIPKDNEILVEVRAVSVNDWDWGLLHGTPFANRLMSGLLRPNKKILGSDVAGRVEAVGKGVSRFGRVMKCLGT